jgi:hypothetical protein
MNAAIDFPIGFHAMPHDSAVAVRADRCQRVDRAFEAVECVMLTGYDHFKRLVVFIFANFACSHTQFFRASAPLRRCPPGFEKVEITQESDIFPWRRLWKYQSN